MSTRKAHPIICVIALGAYLLNLVAAAGGAVLCQNPAGESSIELVGDHDHCPDTIEIIHEPDTGSCWCSACPCEDRPLALDVPPLQRNDSARACLSKSLSHCFLQPIDMHPRTVDHYSFADRTPLACDRSLRQLRTVVLIV